MNLSHNIESFMRDIIVIGVLDERVLERMVRERDLTLKRAIEIRQFSEQTQQYSEILRKECEVSTVNKQYYKRDKRQSCPSRCNLSQAQWSGNMGNKVNKKRCNRCRPYKKKGHFPKVCLSSNKLD